jgi:glycosyltransferase involved in cell wall biosynthesis
MPTKVLHIITRMDMGGSAQNTLDTCLELALKDYSVLLAYGPTLESKMTRAEARRVERKLAQARRRGVATICVPTLLRRPDPLADLRAFGFLWKLISGTRPDIVHTHTSKAGLLGRLAARLQRVPLIVQTPHGHVFYGHFNPLVSRLFLMIEKMAGRLTDAMIALTEQERHDYVRFDVISPEKIVTIHSGVDLRRFSGSNGRGAAVKRRLDLSPDDFVIGSVGWLLPIKGPQILLKAFERLHREGIPAKLVYVGKGELENNLRRESRRLHLAPHIRFLGWQDNIAEIMSAFDVFVLPSLNEGMGRVLVEAMAAARPIVASRTGGIPDLVVQGENGILFPVGDDRALARALRRLQRHPEEARRMGLNGKRRSQCYSDVSMVAKIDELYRSLVQKHAPAPTRH